MKYYMHSIWGLLFIVLFSVNANAANDEFYRLIDMLEAKGTISTKEKQKLERAAEKSTTQTNEVPKIESKGGIELTTFDGQSSFEFGGRLMIDAGFFSEDINNLGDGTELRRARLEAEGVFMGDWGYEFAVDFSGGDGDIKDAYIEYRNLWPGKLVIGQFKEPFSLEELTSSRYITFMERALINEFAPGRNIGAGYKTYTDDWTMAFGIFGEAFDDDVDAEGNEGYGMSARFTWSPLHKKTSVLHFGLSLSARVPDDEGEVKFDSRPESHMTDVKYVNTGKIANIDIINKTGLEFAWVSGPFSIQSETMSVQLDRETGHENYQFSGFYIYGSWFLTGESRRYKYKKAAFGRVKPKDVSGAWELALRYSSLDLNDSVITGGKEENITLAVNLYINPQLRIMANYIIVDNDIHANDDGDATGNDDPSIFQLRLQADF